MDLAPFEFDSDILRAQNSLRLANSTDCSTTVIKRIRQRNWTWGYSADCSTWTVDDFRAVSVGEGGILALRIDFIIPPPAHTESCPWRGVLGERGVRAPRYDQVSTLRKEIRPDEGIFPVRLLRFNILADRGEAAHSEREDPVMSGLSEHRRFQSPLDLLLPHCVLTRAAIVIPGACQSHRALPFFPILRPLGGSATVR